MSDDDDSRSHDLSFSRFSRTKRAVGGIKSQSKRGSKNVSQTWWGKRWIEVLESFDVGGRLQRGRAYARKGQVLSIEVAKGAVTARVQGSEVQPYKVTINISVLTESQWQMLLSQFAEKAIYSAKLLTRQMPPSIEEAFSKSGLSLFPTRGSDLKTDCSCPDWSNPCKHIAAVYYLLGEEFDRDPFLLLTLRGLTEDELLTELDKLLRGGSGFADDAASLPPAESSQTRRKGGKPTLKSKVSDDVSIISHPSASMSTEGNFWNAGRIPVELTGDLRVPERPAVLARNLGNFPFWRGQEDFWQSLEAIYKKSSADNLRRLVGDKDSKD